MDPRYKDTNLSVLALHLTVKLQRRKNRQHGAFLAGVRSRGIKWFDGVRVVGDYVYRKDL